MEGKRRMTRTKSLAHRYPNWDEMTLDMLVEIFATFHVMDLVLNLSRVCRSWYLACSCPSLWKHQTLDLSVLGRYFPIPPSAEAWNQDKCSSRIYTRILRDAFDLSCGTITKLIFHFHVCIKDEHLNLVADRCPRLQKLVQPRWHSLSLEVLQRCLNVWGSTLESLMVPDICFPDELLIKIIGENFPNLKELKFMTALDNDLATSIVTFLPRLKVLSMRGTTIGNNALDFLINEMKNLDVLNITHSLILYSPPLSTVTHSCLDDNFIISQRARDRTQIFSCHETVCNYCEGNSWPINLSLSGGVILEKMFGGWTRSVRYHTN